MSIAVAFVVGNWLILHLPAMPDLPMLGMLIPLCLFLVRPVFGGDGSGVEGFGEHGARVCAGFILGALLSVATIIIEQDRRISGQARSQEVLAGVVFDLPRVSADKTRFMFRVKEGERAGASIRLTWFNPPLEIKPGQHWRLAMQIRPPRGSINFDLFDYEQWLFARHIHGVGYVVDSEGAMLLSDSALPDRFRLWLRTRLIRAMSDDQVATALALTLGDSSQLTRRHWEVLNRTGTTHLLIVSGLHVGLVAGLAMALARLLGLSVSGSVIVTMLLTASYATISGWGLPVQRAFLMTSVVLLSLLVQRKLRFAHQFMMALLAVTLMQPLASLLSGFWLSFGAVLALLLALGNRPIRGMGLRRWFRAAGSSQWVVFIALLPLLGYLHQLIPIGSVAVNFLAIPWVGLLLVPVLLFATVLLLVVEPAGEFLLAVAGTLSRTLWKLLEQFAQSEIVLPVASMHWVYLAAALGGALILLLPKGLVPRWPGFLLLCLIPVRHGDPWTDSLRITFLDVGQGLSVLIETRHRVVLYDTGPEVGEQFSAAREFVLPTLRKKGWRAIDYLVISHLDNDHAGGESTLRRSIPIRHIIKPWSCNESWRFGDVTFDAFTMDMPAGSSNDNSCLLLVSHDDHQILLTGDIETAAEQQLLPKIPAPVSLISVPHHGSRTSSSPALLNRVVPGVAVVSSGFLNRFGHPHPEIVERYRHRSILLLNTADKGAIEFTFREKNLLVRTAREISPAIWRQHADQTGEH